MIRFLTARRTSWIVLLLALAAGAALFALGSGSTGSTAPPVGLPDSAESVRADAVAERIAGEETTSALLVVEAEDGPLSDGQLAQLREAQTELQSIAADGAVPPPTLSDDGDVALLVVPLEVEDDVDAQAGRADELRAAVADAIDGARVYLSGPEGFEVDVAAVFDGADFRLLLVTVIVVAVLLLITYRSPWLWLVPLTVIGLADALAGIVARRVAGALGYELDASVTGILSVLVFGAGTNYALLLIARYRDELRHVDDRRQAMAAALRGAGPAVIASGSTVALSLLTLLVAQLAGNRALGLACAIGVVVAMVFALIVLPAALLLFGRGLFWPYVPRVGTADTAERSPWARLGRGVQRRPILVAVAGAVVLAAAASGMVTVRTGLAQSEQFVREPEAVAGQAVLERAFPAGSSSPTIVIADDAEVADVVRGLEDVRGVDSVAPGDSADGSTRIQVVLDAEGESGSALATVERMRDALDGIGSGEAIVGGADARALDLRAATAADQALVIPVILALVFLVLVVLLRALVAPVLLLFTVVASFFASVGASWYLFETVFGFPALDDNVLLLSFLFLVALGVDYNIFLVTRAKEEAARAGTREGMVRALAATGGVITSAGVLLAAVFAVLGVLPLITLTQIGIIVCVGVLLDTLLVRTVVVPALAFLTGDRFWWPRRPSVPAARG
ncbi:RND superfamily putative drug exporter [Diaminobutyricimonas aerilata]|uniref:RND superfamily putative drug exporter n=1 Tax=Diaminobutyricimonas aerilata TaxID=1162967 RepID=A0A2M9CL02_9MICO|nr:MMPL family transporter [Diaminobutyricimonas aerilata]PJJ72581.1 RND superfamily putative drug exporter [Diaminobutyricimonas aerilata]